MKNLPHAGIKNTTAFRLAPLSLMAAVLCLTALFTTSAKAALPFTAGNVVVFSADSASVNNTTFSILELNNATAAQATPVTTVAISGTGANALRTSGSATSTGYLADSDDGTLVLFDAHNSTTTSGNANTLTARGAGTLNNAGTFNLAATYTGTSGDQARGAVTINNSLVYISDQGGIFTNSSAKLWAANTRSIKSFGGTLYVLQQSTTSTNIVVSTLSADGKPLTGLPGLANDTTANDFYLVSSGSNGSTYDVLYILTTAGIKKYSLVSGTWTANSSYATVTGFGLCAAKSGSGAVLYVTTGTGATAANNLVKVTDTAGYNSNIAVTTANNVTLYTAAAGTTMKGVAFAPANPAAVAPSVTASAATSIATNTATLNGNVTSDNGSAITERGFVFKTNSSVTISDNKTVVAGTTGAYTLSPALMPNTQYYFRAYAINLGGTTLSTLETNFWTLANVPAAPTVANPTTNTLQVSVNANGNPATTTFAIRETTLNKYVQANGSLDTSAVFQTVATWGTKTVTGLITNTTYTFEVKARNGASMETAFGPSASGTTATNAPVGITSVNLNNYVRVGRYSLPHPINTTPPNSTNLLCEEASGVTYNWDTDTLFIIGDGARSITEVTKTGALVSTMTLALGNSPQGTDFYDTEGITYIGGGQFVFTEERDRQLVKCTYSANSVLNRALAQTVDLGTFSPNLGTEGASYDPITGGFIAIKEKTPIGVFQTDVDFGAGTASNGSPTTDNSTNLFDTTLLGLNDLADVFALANIPGLTNQTDFTHLLLISQEDGKVLNVDRAGNISSTLTIRRNPGDALAVADMQHEGITMDRDGIIYIVNENGGGDIQHPELWVYAPATLPNQAPTAIILTNKVSAIVENFSTVNAIKMADIFVTDDGLGTNVLSLTGADAASFQIVGDALYLVAGTVLDYETKTNYTVTVVVDDLSVGATPDATNVFNLAVTDVVNEGGGSVGGLIISEVASWSSSSPLGADWFEVSNTGTNTIDITGWKMDDSTAAYGSSAFLNGITNIAPGESVIFIETADLPTAKAAFLNLWFGLNTPTNLQIGSYTGTALSLSTGGDGVTLFDTNQAITARVVFGAAPASPKLATFDNAAGISGTNISLARLSVPRVYGAFIAANDANETGSPGSIGGLIISEVAAWSSSSSPLGADWFEVINTSPNAIDITGWKVDDNSKSFASSALLTVITNIAPGEAVIFIETNNLAGAKVTFLNQWFGANPPAGLQVGSYSGSGLGLGSGGDAVNLFDSIGTLRASVTFGASPSASPFKTFDNTFGLNNAVVSELSAVGVHGAFAAVNSTNEIGSPGLGSKVIVSEVAPWSSGNSPVGADWFELSNVGATPVDITGWKMDDNSQSPAGAGAMTGITNIAPGESVIFIDTATLSTTKSNFLANWFGTNAPADLQVGAYPAGNGLSTGGDGVTIYDAANNLKAVVTFGASSAAPFRTFDNAAGLDGLANSVLVQLSTNGINGAFSAVNSSNEIGSPGILTVPTVTFTSTGGLLNLRWSLDYSTYRLLETADLTSWSNASSGVLLTNGQFSVSIPQTNNFRVYRLRK